MASLLKEMSKEDRKKLKYVMMGMQIMKGAEKAGQEMERIKRLLPILLPVLLCYIFKATGKLEGSFEYSQTYMLLYLCIKSVL